MPISIHELYRYWLFHILSSDFCSTISWIDIREYYELDQYMNIGWTACGNMSHYSREFNTGGAASFSLNNAVTSITFSWSRRSAFLSTRDGVSYFECTFVKHLNLCSTLDVIGDFSRLIWLIRCRWFSFKQLSHLLGYLITTKSRKGLSYLITTKWRKKMEWGLHLHTELEWMNRRIQYVIATQI